jgi:hypothetical protein
VQALSFNSVEKAAEFLACAQVVGQVTSTQYKQAEGDWSQRLSSVIDWAKANPQYAGPILGALAGGGFGALTSLAKDKEDRNTLSSMLTGGLGGGLLGGGIGYMMKNRDAVTGKGPKRTPRQTVADAVQDMMNEGTLSIDPSGEAQGGMVFPDVESAKQRINEVMGMTGPEALRGVMDGTVTPEEYALRVRGVRRQPITGSRPSGDQPWYGKAWDFATATDPEPTLRGMNIPVPEGASDEDLARIKQWAEDHWRQAYEADKGDRGGLAGNAAMSAGLAGLGEGGTVLAGQRTLNDFKAGLRDILARETASWEAAGSPKHMDVTKPGGRSNLIRTAVDRLLSSGREDELRKMMRHMRQAPTDRFSAFYRKLQGLPGFARSQNPPSVNAVDDLVASVNPRARVRPGQPAAPATDPFIDQLLKGTSQSVDDLAAASPELQKALNEAWQTGQVHSGSRLRPWWDRAVTGSRGVSTPGYRAHPDAPAAAGKRWVSPNMRAHVGGIGSGLGRAGAYIGLPLLFNWGMDQAHKISWRNRPVELPKPSWQPMEPAKPAGG